MTEDEAQAWLRDRFGKDIFASLNAYVDLLLAANADQNLISTASESVIWNRHILDAAQLISHAPQAASWLDIGSGAGLPGIVLGIVAERPVCLVEPRRKRAEFLRTVIAALDLEKCDVHQGMIEKMRGRAFPAVTARAVGSLSDLFRSTIQLTDASTIWVLPKGRTAVAELETAREAWQGVFHVEQSLSDPDARIIVATAIKAK